MFVFNHGACQECGQEIRTIGTIENGLKDVICLQCGTRLERVCRECAVKPHTACGGALALFRDQPVPRVFAAIRQKQCDIAIGIMEREGYDVCALYDPDRLESPLTHAAQNNDPEGCKLLLDRGANPAIGSRYGGQTPLMLIIQRRSTAAGSKNFADVIRLLGSTVNYQDCDGRTAVMFAAMGAGLFGSRRGNIGLIRLLIELGADLEIQDKHGKTALGYAKLINRGSKARANDGVIQFLEQQMVMQMAYRSFQEHYCYSFSNDGALICHRKEVVGPMALT